MLTVRLHFRFTLTGLKEEKSSYVKATYEFAYGDTCHSLAWLCQNNNVSTLSLLTDKIALDGSVAEAVKDPLLKFTPNGDSSPTYCPSAIVAGINAKNLKVFDLRQNQGSKAALTTFTRAVFGACVDPFMEYRIASFIDDQVVIWDLRNFEKPIVTLTQNQKVSRLEWSPTR